MATECVTGAYKATSVDAQGATVVACTGKYNGDSFDISRGMHQFIVGEMFLRHFWTKNLLLRSRIKLSGSSHLLLQTVPNFWGKIMLMAFCEKLN